MKPKRIPAYQTEAEMCAAFIPWAAAQGWTCYAETAGWDMLLVDRTGRQIGIQAKMAFNLKVITQTIPKHLAHLQVGPDYRAVLIPRYSADAEEVLGLLGVTVLHGFEKAGEFSPGLSQIERWPSWGAAERHALPEYVPDVAAGASGPVQLTRWKIGALKLLAVLEHRGTLWRSDFKRFGVDPRTWLNPGLGWLKAVGIGAQLQYVKGPNLPDFAGQHPIVYQQIRKDLLGLDPTPAPVPT